MISFIFWLLFMVAFSINRQRQSWLWAQFFLLIGLVFAVIFEKKRCKFIRTNSKNEEVIVIDYDDDDDDDNNEYKNKRIMNYVTGLPGKPEIGANNCGVSGIPRISKAALPD